MYNTQQPQMSFKSHQLVVSLSPLKLNHEIVTEIEKSVGLVFMAHREPCRVCFAHQNDQLQDAYKQVFYATDLLAYIYAILSTTQHHLKPIELHRPDLPPIPYPTDNLTFWKWVKLGHQLAEN